MNILIIYAHPEPKSFNSALKDLAVSELTSSRSSSQSVGFICDEFQSCC